MRELKLSLAELRELKLVCEMALASSLPEPRRVVYQALSRKLHRALREAVCPRCRVRERGRRRVCDACYMAERREIPDSATCYT